MNHGDTEINQLPYLFFVSCLIISDRCKPHCHFLHANRAWPFTILPFICFVALDLVDVIYVEHGLNRFDTEFELRKFMGFLYVVICPDVAP